MAGFAKAILISVLVAVVFFLFMNMIFFFPWYMSLVYETFNLSQVAAADNYLKNMNVNAAMDRLKSKPIFSDASVINLIEIEAKNSYGSTAIGEDNADEAYVASGMDDSSKPYRQRGEKITVRIKAAYPFRVKLANADVELVLPVSFQLSTTGLKYYKDLPYYKDIL
ncbi:hypothetical protein DFR58_10516 [Anaerobacterium chartisolvens]|uniref:Uncharacterized protein n=1 Tax=Anaerobacterium chartisolvens TaxID=1297424 RepID=A0A369BCD0_9FIRM|nr:hypothetical protein [Anaerobacterium chartisolvens]RCX18258.1 hypothetical protein DFR58_10516 [Anaerobacterium chartisolvens]